MPCLHHTDMSGNSPDEYFVSPFDPCPAVKCPCPGDCPGTLKSDGQNIDHTLTFLQCDKCVCSYVAESSGSDSALYQEKQREKVLEALTAVRAGIISNEEFQNVVEARLK